MASVPQARPEASDAMVSPAPLALKMSGISKEFGPVKALADVDFEVRRGEVHALMGENGAGKSTLMKILSGVYSPTSGVLYLGDQQTTFSGPNDASRAGIAIIHQEFNLFPNLTAAENMFINRGGFGDRLGRFSWTDMRREAERIVQSIGGRFDVMSEVQHLSVHNQQVLEIAKAIAANADILIMDEPSAALPESDVQKMFGVVRELRARGVAIIYVSHRMHEIFQIADRMTVIRDGRVAGTRELSETSEAEIIRLMIGKDVTLFGDMVRSGSTDVVLAATDLELTKDKRVSFTVGRGEILSLFGLAGAGSHTVAERLFGLKAGGGHVEVDGRRANIASPRTAIRSGIAYVPADRHRHGLIKPMTVLENISLAVLPGLADRGWVRNAEEVSLAAKYKTLLNIRTSSLQQKVETLSGGNQQKVVLSKWLASSPKVLVLEEPTRGVDIGAKQEIYRIIQEIAASGFGIILISSEIPEVLGLGDRILVMHEGRIVSEIMKADATYALLLHAASGLN